IQGGRARGNYHLGLGVSSRRTMFEHRASLGLTTGCIDAAPGRNGTLDQSAHSESLTRLTPERSRAASRVRYGTPVIGSAASGATSSKGRIAKARAVSPECGTVSDAVSMRVWAIQRM